MALLDKAFKGNLWTGLAIGAGAVIAAPAIIPALGRMVRPVAKSAVKGLLILAEKGKEMLATTKKAAPVQDKQKPVRAEKSKLRTLTGKVEQVDTSARIVKVAKKVKGKELKTVINIANKASIRMGRQRKKFTDLKEGDKIVIKYTDSEGKKLSRSLSIMPLQKLVQTDKKTKSG